MLNVLDVVVKHGLLATESAERAQRLADQTRTPLSAVLTRLGLVSEQALAKLLSDQLLLPLLQRSALVPDAAMPGDMSPDFLQARKLLPVRCEADDVVLAMANPLDDAALAGASFVYGHTLQRAVALESDIDDAWRAVTSVDARA